MANSQPTQATVSVGSGDTIGSVPTVAGLAGKHFGAGLVRQVQFQFNDVAFTLTDNVSTGSGYLKIYDFPTGGIAVLGLFGKLTYATALTTDADAISSFGTSSVGAVGVLTANGVANIVPPTATAIATSAATFNVASVTSAITQLTDSTGRTPDSTLANHADLSTYGTDAATIESNISDLGGKVNAILRQIEGCGMKILDGTNTAADLYLNIATPNDPSTSNSITIDGTLTLTYIYLGSRTALD